MWLTGPGFGNSAMSLLIGALPSAQLPFVVQTPVFSALVQVSVAANARSTAHVLGIAASAADAMRPRRRQFPFLCIALHFVTCARCVRITARWRNRSEFGVRIQHCRPAGSLRRRRVIWTDTDAAIRPAGGTKTRRDPRRTACAAGTLVA